MAARWRSLPLQVRQCILLFCDGHTAAALAHTCRLLYDTIPADRWLWATLYEMTFPQTEEERHWREWQLAGLARTNGYGGNISAATSVDPSEPVHAVDWYRVYRRRVALERRWRAGRCTEQRVTLPLSRSHKVGQVQVKATSPWRTILLLSPDWELLVVEHGCARVNAPYKLSWAPGCWPGPREFLQNADYIVAVSNFSGHQHSTWIWRTGSHKPITDRWPILSNSSRCPVELYGRWLLVTDANTGASVTAFSRGVCRDFHVLDLVDGGTVSVTVPGGYATCHLQAAGPGGLRVYCGRQTLDYAGQGRLEWEVWGWRASGEAHVTRRGACPMHVDLFNGRLSSRRMDAARVLLEAHPVWTNDCLYAVHSLYDSEVLHQGSVGAGHAFPLGRYHLRYLPCGPTLSARMIQKPEGHILLADAIVDLDVGARQPGLNVQLCRALDAICYAVPISPGSSDDKSGSAGNLLSGVTQPLDNHHPNKHDYHYLIDAKAGRLIGKLRLSAGTRPAVAVCATHICLVDVRTRTLTLRDFGASSRTISKRTSRDTTRSSTHGGDRTLAARADAWRLRHAGSFTNTLRKTRRQSYNVWESIFRPG
ncbi:hypothetical protein THASP1DRAFT_29584 [Thamnocephalis sphaerospora]|uniref:F-box domain-containing protein n=1 Tax=Thamnocephalis sphaerospora TaxID=78915 RepID=A0A4P9XRA3_9FUNG|nr:hypothetical protein THASP1DRAFT_29584 [Thamnocephalis sphaerospora]|eukprot:RKP08617.1 hypothetical protein THASP1DRAFT_29584 [Thamnocephalis sphaerospora]